MHRSALAILCLSGCTPGSLLHQGRVGILHPKPAACTLIEDAYVDQGGNVWNLCLHTQTPTCASPLEWTAHLTRYVIHEGRWVYRPLDVDVEASP